MGSAWGCCPEERRDHLDAGRHRDDHLGQWVAGRRVRQPGARGQRRVVARRDAHRRHHWGHQPGGQSCRKGDARWRRQRDAAMRAKKTMLMKWANEKL